MAKRGRKPGLVSLDSLMFELGRLDARRQQIAAQIRSAVSSITSLDVQQPHRASTVLKSVATSVKKARRTMSKEARAKIAAAQKARWAKVRKGAKKGAGQTPSKAQDKARGG